ncbi:MAG: hypothetical protein K2Q34_00920 [Alphaproteobacteria bacterium]|nr:hypothetical protein [Alphaproteobacteria bacterium]
MKILKAVALVAVGLSLVSSGWSMSAKDLPAACAKETNPGPCGHAAERGCTWNGKCVPNCQRIQDPTECGQVQVNGRQHCNWVGPMEPKKGLCRPK